MEERHENEQYFFDAQTASRIADFIHNYQAPCCLCAPTVGRELSQRGVEVRILDIDERFKELPGFRHFDLNRPGWLGETFGIILFDPPFFNAVSVSQLFDVIRRLSGYDYRQKLLRGYPVSKGGFFG